MKTTSFKLISVIMTLALFVIVFFPQNSLAQEGNNKVSLWDLKKIDEGQILKFFQKKVIEEDNSIFIEPEIYNQLENKDNTTVIIKLKDNFNSYDLNEIKKKSKKNINHILEILNPLIKNPESQNEEDNSQKQEIEKYSNNFELLYEYDALNSLSGKINKEGLEILKNSNLVESIYLERILHTSLQQSVPLINATQVWSTVTSSGNLTGTGQTVCVVDSGIDYSHSALGGCLGTNCKVKGGIDFIDMDFDPMDDNGHGTHVAGIVAANDNILKGVAPDAKLIAVKSCNATGSCPNTAMVAGINYCVSNINNLETNIITMSIGDGGEYTSNNCPTWMDFAINFANTLNIPITIASGNDGHKSGISYPACSPNAISVGATYDEDIGSQIYPGTCTDLTTSTDKVTCFSNSGDNLDVMAPGSVITSTTSSTGNACGAPNSQGTGDCIGTSMATPHVAGTIALMMQSNPTMSAGEIKSKLKQNGKNVIDNGNSIVFPRIDAMKTINDIIKVPWSPDYNLEIGTGNYFESVEDSSGKLHLIKRSGANLYYTKMDNNGNKIITDLVITTNASASGAPSIAIDVTDNINIAWEDNRNGNPEIYYKKIDNNGNEIVPDTRITTDSAESRNPKIAVDHLLKSHIVFQDDRNAGRWRIYYEKLDTNGNSLLNEFIVDNPSLTCIGCTWDNKYARNPSISVDSQGNVYLTYEFFKSRYKVVSNAPNTMNIYELHYKKLDNNGNTIVSDIELESEFFRKSGTSPNFLNIYDVKSKPDNQGNLFILRKEGLNITTTNSGTYVNYHYNYGYKTDFWGLNSSGNSILFRPISTLARYGYSFSQDNQNNFHIAWADPRDGQNEIYYKKIDENGNVIVNDQRLTFASSPSITSSIPVVNIDENKEAHVFFGNSGFAHYKRTMNNLNLEIPQNASIGTTIPLNIKDLNNPNSYYVLALSFGHSPGINLPDGRIIPLDPPIFPISQGYLNSNGRATTYFQVPNDPQYIGTTLYAAFATLNSTDVSSISPHFPIQLTL